VSFAPRLVGAGKSNRSWAYAEEAVLPKPGGVEPDGASGGMRWVRTADWKLYNDGRLFDMRADEQEKNASLVSDDDLEESSARQRLLKAFKELETHSSSTAEKNSPVK
jgi:hypothetical protein